MNTTDNRNSQFPEEDSENRADRCNEPSGKSIHEKIAHIFRSDDFTTQKTHAMFEAWTRTAGQVLISTFDVLAVEQEFFYPLLNPATGAASRTFAEAGKVTILRRKGTDEISILVHKTSGDDIGEDAVFWKKLVVEVQGSKYVLAARQLGYKGVIRVLFNVVKKPGKRQLRSGKDNAETPEEYFSRVVDVMLADGSYFTQREELRDDGHLTAYMINAWASAQLLLYARNKKVYPTNETSCSFFGKCEFIDLCFSGAEVDGVRFRKKAKLLPELATPETDKIRLTASRMRCYGTCPCKYKYVYEDSIEALGEDGEAVYVGSLFHRAAEVWLSQFLLQKHSILPTLPTLF